MNILKNGVSNNAREGKLLSEIDNKFNDLIFKKVIIYYKSFFG